jgi:CHAD domain-containing protein
LGKLSTKPAPKNVHKFRTNSRRVETLIEELIAEPTRNEKKLLKLLTPLRKRAGKTRDLDVQIVSLRNLKIPQEPGRKSQLMRALTEERAKREKKIAKAFDQDTVQVLRRRLKRAAGEVRLPQNTDPLRRGMQQMAKLGAGDVPLNEKTLHQYRIIGKRARYLAELAGSDPQAQQFVAQLKRMQDVLGDWHDWLELTERAKKLFGEVGDSALVSALQNVTRAKFRLALDMLAETRAALAGKKPVAAQPGLHPAADMAVA